MKSIAIKILILSFVVFLSACSKTDTGHSKNDGHNHSHSKNDGHKH